jgi:signal transduction histidine kinase
VAGPDLDHSATLHDGSGPARPHLSGPGSNALRRMVVLSTAAVALAPLLILTGVALVRGRQALQAEALQPAASVAATARRSLELFLTERRAALTFLVNDRSFDELCDPEVLARAIRSMNRSLEVEAFVDLGIIDQGGNQLCYWGPYDLAGRNYAGQGWFGQVVRRGTYTSDVFLGYRHVPHFVIAIKHELENGGFYVVRATIDAELFGEQLLEVAVQPDDDLFLINREGVLQTRSRRYGRALEPMAWQPVIAAAGSYTIETEDPTGEDLIVTTAVVESSPYVVVLVKSYREVMHGWLLLRQELLIFVAISSGLILIVILWGANQFVGHLREVNRRRAALMHQAEYSNKLASLGRLAAGVAHEVNNPLAIIGEKAGLLRDLAERDTDFSQRARVLTTLDSIVRSVDRCSAITHRLLGFAKHMDVHHEVIDLRTLLREVLGFLGKEAEHRNISVMIAAEPVLPTITSDRGQLQQVFLNLLNNAFAAVTDGGTIEIAFSVPRPGEIRCTISDDGVGIPTEHLERIFEPFFTTKGAAGTGLGLSITHGIVTKLGGTIEVDSIIGQGTRFTVILPVERRE